MCGPVKNLFHQIKDIGLDGIRALTASPIGDTPAELALDVISEDLIINEEIPASVFVSGPVEGIASALDEPERRSEIGTQLQYSHSIIAEIRDILTWENQEAAHRASLSVLW